MSAWAPKNETLVYRGFIQAVRQIPVDCLSQATTAPLHILAINLFTNNGTTH
jgi:hypothetical protein